MNVRLITHGIWGAPEVIHLHKEDANLWLSSLSKQPLSNKPFQKPMQGARLSSYEVELWGRRVGKVNRGC